VLELRGFTLVELLVAMMIIGVMATAGYPKMVETVHQIRLEQHARSIYEDICLTRNAAIAAGKADTYSVMNFYHFADSAANPITSYDMLDHEGNPVKTALMKYCDESDAAVSVPRAIISSDSTCIETIPAVSWGASSTVPLSRFIMFDRHGDAWYRPSSGGPNDLASISRGIDIFMIRPLNLVSMSSYNDLGGWSILLDTDTGRPTLIRHAP
jgi:prepilin-type N-terminal cleavage/methylation domain-containing protein